MFCGTCWLLAAVMRFSLRSQRPSSCICFGLSIAVFEGSPELHDGTVAVELNDGRSVAALTGSDPEALRRHVAQEPASS
jgi:hypothetical protein